eukprot:TRINITY_DN65923_c0_g1_i1.p1 TRINITY_DN65923_c0_g1~~TRINITY_DN65923_c0_g1_i1.p1  ORF type:complete len:264 (+),score=25.30 TRINITY_DN65923_c0_g1_i1:64-855(+)
MSCCSLLKQHLDFALDDGAWRDIFQRPKDCKGCGSKVSPRTYFVARLSLFLLWLMAVAWSIVDWIHYHPIVYWPTKLTHIGAVWELLYFAFAAFSTGMAIWSDASNESDEETPWFVSVTWFLGSALMVLSLTVFALYWLLVYEGGPIYSISVVMNGGNFVLAFIDFTWSRRPSNFAHIWVSLMFSIVYATFTWLYFAAGGTHEDGVSPYIYSSINWADDPSGATSLLGLIVLVAIPLMYITFYAMFSFCCKPLISVGDTTMTV